MCVVCVLSCQSELSVRTLYSTSPLRASGLAAGSDEGSASTRVAGNPTCTCHLVPAPSAALAAIFAVVIQRLRVVFLQPASCVLRPASCFPQHIIQCVVLRVPDWAWACVEPLFRRALLWLRLALRCGSWHHAIQGRISISGTISTSGLQGERRRERKKNTTLLERVSSVSEFGRFQDFGPGREAAFRPLGIHPAAVRPRQINASITYLPYHTARPTRQKTRSLGLLSWSAHTPRLVQGPLTCDLLLMT